MAFNHTQKRRAFTVIEALIAMVVFVIAIIGTSAYRYEAALNARRADSYATGVRMTLLLCEGWSGEEGDTAFDPVALFSPDLTIASTVDGPGIPGSFTLLGNYGIVAEGSYYYATLSWRDMATGLKALNIAVSWNPANPGLDDSTSATEVYRVTTFVQDPS